MDQVPRLGKRELFLLLFTCNCVVSVGEVSSSSGCLGWATFFDCGTPLAYHIIMAVTENTFEAICDFMARYQFLESGSRELYVHLKPKTFKNLDEMAKEAYLFAEARGGVYTCTNKGQHDNRGVAQNRSILYWNKASRKQEIECCICGKGHLTIKCYKNGNTMQVSSAEKGNEAKGG